ncbi:MAG: hypothetical protein EZS28_004966 [Streblomastix strix]|uniref:Uncharacterized protein n=1 Tax=Streblomastix strix TaxID=222440 RepID=A0A5J4WWT8_9EUKA|nr:MAG: hypothetical protein EZS28_004966 [Streblomastix strix]
MEGEQVSDFQDLISTVQDSFEGQIAYLRKENEQLKLQLDQSKNEQKQLLNDYEEEKRKRIQSENQLLQEREEWKRQIDQQNSEKQDLIQQNQNININQSNNELTQPSALFQQKDVRQIFDALESEKRKRLQVETELNKEKRQNWEEQERNKTKIERYESEIKKLRNRDIRKTEMTEIEKERDASRSSEIEAMKMKVLQAQDEVRESSKRQRGVEMDLNYITSATYKLRELIVNTITNENRISSSSSSSSSLDITQRSQSQQQILSSSGYSDTPKWMLPTSQLPQIPQHSQSVKDTIPGQMQQSPSLFIQQLTSNTSLIDHSIKPHTSPLHSLQQPQYSLTLINQKSNQSPPRSPSRISQMPPIGNIQTLSTNTPLLVVPTVTAFEKSLRALILRYKQVSEQNITLRQDMSIITSQLIQKQRLLDKLRIKYGIHDEGGEPQFPNTNLTINNTSNDAEKTKTEDEQKQNQQQQEGEEQETIPYNLDPITAKPYQIPPPISDFAKSIVIIQPSQSEGEKESILQEARLKEQEYNRSIEIDILQGRGKDKDWQREIDRNKEKIKQERHGSQSNELIQANTKPPQSSNAPASIPFTQLQTPSIKDRLSHHSLNPQDHIQQTEISSPSSNITKYPPAVHHSISHYSAINPSSSLSSNQNIRMNINDRIDFERRDVIINKFLNTGPSIYGSNRDGYSLFQQHKRGDDMPILSSIPNQIGLSPGYGQSLSQYQQASGLSFNTQNRYSQQNNQN